MLGRSHLPTEKSETHVDVIKNEWLAGYQLVVARVSSGELGLHVDAPDQEWIELVRRYRDEQGVRDDAAFMESLHERMNGDYLFATPAHPVDECPFPRPVIPLESVDAQAQHAHSKRA